MSVSPSRRQRRDLERRADRVLKQLSGQPMVADADASPKTHAVVAGEGTVPGIVRREHILPALALVGLTVEGLDSVLTEIAASPKDDGRRFPVLIMIEGWLQLAWIQVHPVVAGGDA